MKRVEESDNDGEDGCNQGSSRIRYMKVKDGESNREDTGLFEVTISPKTDAAVRVYCAAVPDTGADVSVAGVGLLNVLNSDFKRLRRARINLSTANGLNLKAIGKLPCVIEYENRKTELDIYICTGVRELVIDKTTLRNLGVIHEDFPRSLPKEGDSALHNPHLQKCDDRTQTGRGYDIRCRPKQLKNRRSVLTEEKRTTTLMEKGKSSATSEKFLYNKGKERFPVSSSAILELARSGNHQNPENQITKRRRALHNAYWSGISQDIRNSMETCDEFRRIRPPLPKRTKHDINKDSFSMK